MARINIDRGTVLAMLTAAFLGGYLIQISYPWTKDVPEGKLSPQASDPAIKRYTEALRYIEERAMFSDSVGNFQDMATESLKVFLAQKDPYSDLLTPDEFLKFRATGGHYAGIGLDVEKRRNGDIICYPIANGPAALAGIKPGERLLALDGISLLGKSLPTVAAMATGKPGTDVVVELADLSGVSRQVTVTRISIAAPVVADYTFRSVRIMKLPYFTPNTKQELHYLLSTWSKGKPLIIDLRGCGGGDFYAAVDSAMLFLKQGEPIISVDGRAGTRSYSATGIREPPAQPVFLWQDEFTASAAEIFIAALTENARAISIGKTTAGKGTRQDIIELQDGGALILTTGYLITPHGIRFEGKGLRPMRLVEERINDTGTFLNRTRASMHQKN